MSATGTVDGKARSRRIGILISIAVLAVVLFVALALIKPAMPDRIQLLTGPQGGAYHTLGKAYATELGKRGLVTDVIVTDGGLDNVRRLASGNGDTRNTVAFAPSTVGHGSVSGVDTSRLVSLGSVALEPLWLFYRSELDIQGIPDLAGLVVATEEQGSISNYVAGALVERNGIADQVEIRPMGEEPGESIGDAFSTETVDAVFVTGASGTPRIENLLYARSVSFMSFDRAETYAVLIPGISTLTVPEGVFDLQRGIPPRDAYLLSATTTLVALDRLSPAVAPMMLVAAADLRQENNVFSSEFDLPSKRYVELPLDRSARRYFDQGQTGLSKYLPYNVTRWLNHLGFVVLPLVGVAAVLLKIVPTGLRIGSQMRLTGLLKKLEAVEKADASGGDRASLAAELDRIDRASVTMFVPRSTVHDYIDFRQFLHDMRERIEKENPPA